MHLIGYWIESLADTNYFPPQELIGELPPETKRRIAEYLDAGSLFAEYRGLSWCRFGCIHVHMGYRELTDGYWVWPEGLSHYIRDHAVTLPDQFIEHVLSGGSKVSSPVQKGDLDDGLWIKWCQARSTGHLRAAIADARRSASSRAEELRNAYWKQKELQVGLSATRCLYQACSSMALIGLAFCAKHAAAMEHSGPERLVYHQGLVELLNT